MLRKASRSGTEDDNADSGAETAESDCSKMSSTSSDFMATPVDEPLLMTLHLLANPGDSLMLQHSLDMLLKWVCPGLRLFNVSERACPLRDRASSRLSPVAGYPSLAVTLFLHESYGEERILRVLDFLQRPPWRYHHTESCRGRTGIHIASTTSPANALLRPYLLPSRDFYSLGGGMPVWGVRPVHCGSETLRVTLYSGYDNFEDALRLYETILRRRAEEQKAGFCWFTLRAEDGLCLQLALKQLSPGVRVEPCDSAVLQFRVEEIGQLVPLLPNPCTPISATRWQTEDLDGNKILFQVKGRVQPTRSTTSAFPLHDPLRAQPRGVAPAPLKTVSLCAQKPLLKDGGVFVSQRTLGSVRCGGGSEENGWSDSLCSSPLGSSSFSSQRSSPAALSVHPYEPCLAASSVPEPSPSRVPQGVPETNVDTGLAVTPRPERPAVVGASGLQSLGRDLPRSLPDADASVRAQGMAPACRTTAWDRDPNAPGTRQTCQATGPSQSAVFWQSHTSLTPREPAVQDDEFFI